MILERAKGKRKWLGLGVVFQYYNICLMPGREDGTVGYLTGHRKIVDGEDTEGKNTKGI